MGHRQSARSLQVAAQHAGPLLAQDRVMKCKYSDDEEWLALAELDESQQAAAESQGADGHQTADVEIPESLVTEYGPEQDMSGAEAPAQTTEESAVGQVATTPKVRPIQMGEFLRKWVSRRLKVLNSGDVSRVMMAMRQLGVGVSAGAEDLEDWRAHTPAIAHKGGREQLLRHARMESSAASSQGKPSPSFRGDMLEAPSAIAC